MLYELSERGIHLLPVEEDYVEAKLPVKDREAEQNAIRDIAYAIESFYIRSEVNESSDIITKIRENLDYERVFLEDQEKDWKVIRWLANSRCEVTNRSIPERHLNLEVPPSLARSCSRTTTSARPSASPACSSARTTSSNSRYCLSDSGHRNAGAHASPELHGCQGGRQPAQVGPQRKGNRHCLT